MFYVVYEHEEDAKWRKENYDNVRSIKSRSDADP